MTMKTIALDHLHPCPFNPRKTLNNIEQLADSLIADGQLQPLVVRPHPTEGKGHFEVLCGHRRHAAAGLASIPELVCSVRTCDDAEALFIMLAENRERDDLAPLDEAASFGMARDQHGRSVEEIATQIGRGEDYVRARLRLLELAPEAQDAMRAGRLPLGSALELIRLQDHAEQVSVLQQIAGDEHRDPATAREARRAVEQRMRRLSDAPWALGESDLVPAAGACSTCPKRTGAQRGLFGDDNLDEIDRCTDGGCWSTKVRALGERRLEGARAKGLRIIDDVEERNKVISFDGVHGPQVSPAYVNLDERCYEDGKGAKTWREVLKKAPPAASAVVSERSGAVLEVVKKTDAVKAARAAGAAWAQPVEKGAKGDGKADKARQAKLLERALDAIADAMVGDPHTGVHAAAARFVIDSIDEDVVRPVLDRLEVDHNTKAIDQYLAAASFQKIAALLFSLLARHTGYWSKIELHDDALDRALKAAKLDVKRIEKEMEAPPAKASPKGKPSSKVKAPKAKAKPAKRKAA